MTNQTDKELLELAAKAAGYAHLTEWSESISDHDSEHWGCAALHAAGSGGQCQSFNPLTDDGDALRLAVKLDMNVDIQGAYIRVDCGDNFVNEQSSGAPLASTRRAIVRAAAEIGAKL